MNSSNDKQTNNEINQSAVLMIDNYFNKLINKIDICSETVLKDQTLNKQNKNLLDRNRTKLIAYLKDIEKCYISKLNKEKIKQFSSFTELKDKIFDKDQKSIYFYPIKSILVGKLIVSNFSFKDQNLDDILNEFVESNFNYEIFRSRNNLINQSNECLLLGKIKNEIMSCYDKNDNSSAIFKLNFDPTKLSVLDNIHFQFETAIINPDMFKHLYNLEMLNLDRCCFAEIEDNSFKSMSNLKSMFLEGFVENDKFFNINKLTFDGLVNLHSLYLHGLNINGLHEACFTTLLKLKYLDLGANKISYVEKNCFNGLSKLKYLNLGRNQIKTLGKSTFNKILNLRKLDLSRNEIRTIEDDTFHSLFNLDYLYLNENRIKSLNKNVCNGLSSLVKLYLSHNEIEYLGDECFSSLINLEILDLSFNKIKSIGLLTFQGMNYLFRLYLSNNQIEELEDNCFSSLTCLTILDLKSQVYIDENNQSIKTLKKLNKLSFNGLDNLVCLDLSNNDL